MAACLSSTLLPGSKEVSSYLVLKNQSAKWAANAVPPPARLISMPFNVVAMAPPKPSGKAKKVVAVVKLALEAGKATPAPPVGPVLGSKGINIMQFCKEYNAKTSDKAGYVIPVEITIFDEKDRILELHTLLEDKGTTVRWYELVSRKRMDTMNKKRGMKDKSFTYVLKTPPASVLLLKAAGVEKGSNEPKRVKIGKVTADQVRAIATEKLPDLNCSSIDSAMKIIAGTAANMGIDIVPPILTPKEKVPF